MLSRCRRRDMQQKGASALRMHMPREMSAVHETESQGDNTAQVLGWRYTRTVHQGFYKPHRMHLLHSRSTRTRAVCPS